MSCPLSNRYACSCSSLPTPQTRLSPHNFLLPVFVHDGEEDIPIQAMPGCNRLGW